MYQRPLYNKAETDEMPTITKMQIRAIFSNTEQLLPMNQHLLGEIKLRVQSWHPKQLIGDIFEKTVCSQPNFITTNFNSFKI